MDNSIQNHKFYNTFTPFITKATKTAEKTLNGKVFIPQTQQVYSFSKEFYDYMTAGGALAIPILAIAISKKNIFAQMKKTNKEFFKIITNDNNGIFQRLSKKIAIFKYNSLKKFWDFIKPIRTKREIFSLKLNRNEDSFISKTYKKINSIFMNGKIKASQRQYDQTNNAFKMLQQNIEKHLAVITESSQGKIKIALPSRVLLNPKDELPHVFNLSKTADGKSRVSQIKEILSKIETLLKNNNGNFDEITKKITFSCEDIFQKGEATLVALHKSIADKGLSSSKISEILKNLYADLNKYRFAELSDITQQTTSSKARKLAITSFDKNLKILKDTLPNDKIINNQVSNLEKLMLEKTDPSNMGLLEQLRILLKCNDLDLTGIAMNGKNPALLKHYRPDDYMEIKRTITDFSNNLKLSQKTQTELLPTTKKEIQRGGIFTKALAVILPASYLIKRTQSNNEEDKKNAKRNLLSFLVGSITMLGTNYFTMNSQKKSIIYGIIAAFLTSKIADKKLND